MSIGAALAEARQRAGLTVAQVSERTRIRETIIRGIEDDDYSACGGDFYARGHIRAIAKVVGTDARLSLLRHLLKQIVVDWSPARQMTTCRSRFWKVSIILRVQRR